jgi:TetR/AcrR family transcriptional regulator
MIPERSSADTREKILEVAEHAFAREGFAGAHLQAVAEGVGVQKTALYYYFPSKAALYEEVLVRMLQAFDQTVRAAIETAGSPRERMVRLVKDVNDLLAERRNYSQILVRLFVDRVTFQGDTVRLLVEAIVGRLLRFYREGVGEGTFRKLSSRHFFQSVLGMTVFHYASRDFGASVLGVGDLFTRENVAWRRAEVGELLLHGVLSDAE